MHPRFVGCLCFEGGAGSHGLLLELVGLELAERLVDGGRHPRYGGIGLDLGTVEDGRELPIGGPVQPGPESAAGGVD
ncbi:hypothetical protein AB0H36_35975 [Kribbella sp. NPDC050820]|uniref:hypothetical protein n=1 Tax=Kribbella sp. NPDC050820 TaxID=3155408 RepID=UPI0033E2F4F9